MALCVEGGDRERSCSAGEEKDLQRDLPGVLTLHWMIAEELKHAICW